jgi:hypothetical protein
MVLDRPEFVDATALNDDSDISALEFESNKSEYRTPMRAFGESSTSRSTAAGSAESASVAAPGSRLARSVSFIAPMAGQTDPVASQPFYVPASARGGPDARLSVTLVADTNRDGVVNDADIPGKENWTKSLGAIYNVNFDDDNNDGQPDAVNFDDTGRPFGENKVIENAADAADLAPLVIKPLGRCLLPGMKVYLKVASVEDAQSIHVFPSLNVGATAILGDVGDRVSGGAQAATETEITSLVNCQQQSTTLGVEGMYFRYLSGPGVPNYKAFDGYVDFTLEVRGGVNVLGSSSVRMKVAPWISSTHDEATTQVWAQDLGGQNAAFLYTSANEPGYYGLDATGQLNTVSNASQNGSRWFQDQAESGWTQRPGGPKMQILFRLPYYFYNPNQPQPIWPQERVLGPNVGTFQLGKLLGTTSGYGYFGDWGGNLEALPPTASHPLGRIVLGSLGSDALRGFLDSQEVQAPVVTPNTKWLEIGHVDEYLMFLGGNKVGVADPQHAYDLMEAIAPADRGKSTIFAYGANPISGAVTANSGSSTILWTGMDLTGTNWKYVRLYDSSASGSGSQGQVARIKPGGLHNGYVEIDANWNTGTAVERFGANSLSGWVNGKYPKTGDKFTLVEGSKTNSGTPAFITVHEVLADVNFRLVNLNYAQGQIANARNLLDNAAGGPGSLEFIALPVLYTGDSGGSFSTSRSALAFTTDMANGYPLASHVYTARQFGPRDALGQDIFEVNFSQQVPARFVDDYTAYHLGSGDLHCGIIAVRQAPAYDWWGQQP